MRFEIVLLLVLVVVGTITYKVANEMYDAPATVASKVINTNDDFHVISKELYNLPEIVKVNVPVVVVTKPIKKVTVAIEYDLPGVDGNLLFDYLETAENPNSDPDMIGDRHLKHKAYGLLQIRQPCLTDVIRIARKDMIRKYGRVLTIHDMKDRNKARWVARVYLHYYGARYTKLTGKPATYKILAKIHNGGPNGWRPYNMDTRKYWAKVVRMNGFELS